MAARYYQWNYGECMISRARYSMEWLKTNHEYLAYYSEKIPRILDTNFDMIDCVISSDIIKEYKDNIEYYSEHEPEMINKLTLNDYVFNSQDNNDGKLFIDVLSDGSIKYVFTDSDMNKILSAEEYMQWDNRDDWKTPTKYMSQEIIDTCCKNIKIIEDLGSLMTNEEFDEFINCDYSWDLWQLKK